MNIEIYDNNTPLHLPKEFELEASFKNPLFSKDEGSGTLPATLPGTPHNFAAFSFPERVDIAERILQRRVRITNGIYQRMGTATVLDASKGDGININIGFDEGEFWDKINNLPLPELFTDKNPENVINYGSVANAITEMNRILTNPKETDEFSVFTILLDVVKNDVRTVYYRINEIMEIQNNKYRLKYIDNWKEWILFDKVWTEINNPAGYGISPFLKLGVLLDKIFHLLDYKLINNPFKTDSELKKIVVLNNNRDTIASGVLRYSDIIPTCTANELLDTLMAKFGAVLFVNSNDHTASIRLIRDILFEDAQIDLTKYRGKEFKNYFERGKQLKLTSKKSIENLDFFITAKTDKDTFEEFTNTYSNDFNISISRYDILSNPDINTIISYAQLENSFYIWNFAQNIPQKLSILSSKFFDWDRKHKDFDYLELSGADEQIPMVSESYNHVIPAYLTGMRNNNSILTINKETSTEKADEKANNDNPLAFCLTHKINNLDVTYGSSFSQCPLNFQTSNVNIDLCYYGEKGLFNNFMKEYDCYLQYALEKTDCSFHIPEVEKQLIDITRPIMSDNQRFLFEEMKIKIGKQSPSDLTLRSLTLRGAKCDYNFISINQAEYYYILNNHVYFEVERIIQKLNSKNNLQRLLIYNIVNNQLIVDERDVSFYNTSSMYFYNYASQFSNNYNDIAINAQNNPLSGLVDWEKGMNYPGWIEYELLNKYFVSPEVRNTRNTYNIYSGFILVNKNEKKDYFLAFKTHIQVPPPSNDYDPPPQIDTQYTGLYMPEGIYKRKTYNLFPPYNMFEENIYLEAVDRDLISVNILLPIYRYFAKVKI